MPHIKGGGSVQAPRRTSNHKRGGGLTPLRIVSTIALVGGWLWLFASIIRAHYFPYLHKPGDAASRVQVSGTRFILFAMTYPEYDAEHIFSIGRLFRRDGEHDRDVGPASPRAIESGNLPVVPRVGEPTRNCLPALQKRDAADHRRGPAVAGSAGRSDCRAA
jgi:hypothetical protein